MSNSELCSSCGEIRYIENVICTKCEGGMATTTGKERVKQYRLRQKELGRLKREMYLTDAEHKQLKAKLAELRKSA